MAKKGKTIWVTTEEYALIAESKELFTGFTKTKISWGAYICALSLGALAAKASIGIAISCPGCGHEVEINMVNPRSVLHRKPRPGQTTG